MQLPTYIIDFDSTIVRCESLEELARLALRDRADREPVLRQLQAITNQGMAGTLPFDESLHRRLQLFAADQAHVAKLAARLQKDITPSVLRNKNWFLRNSERIYVISGGFEEYIVPVVAKLGIATNHVLANTFILDGGLIVGHDETRLLAKAGGKIRQLVELGLPRPVIVIGDGYTDYEMRAAGAADEFWAFCGNVSRPNVIEHADRVLMNFDDVAKSTSPAIQ